MGVWTLQPSMHRAEGSVSPSSEESSISWSSVSSPQVPSCWETLHFPKVAPKVRWFQGRGFEVASFPSTCLLQSMLYNLFE